MRRWLAVLVLVSILIFPSLAKAKLYEGLEVYLSSEAALCVDLDSKRTLYSKEGGAVLPIGLSARMMLMTLCLEQMAPTQRVPISFEAAKRDLPPKGVPSLKAGSKEPLSYLLMRLYQDGSHGVCWALAEALAGSPENCLKEMNRKARVLDLRQSTFASLTGDLSLSSNDGFDLSKAPGPKAQRSSLEDCARLAMALRKAPHSASILEQSEQLVLDGRKSLVRLSSKAPRLWTSTKDPISMVFHHGQGDFSTSLVLSEPKEGPRLFLFFSSKGFDASRDCYRLSEAVSDYYVSSTLIHKGELWPQAKTLLKDGRSVDLMALEDLSYLHPKNDAFLKDSTKIQSEKLFAPPLAYATPMGELRFTLADDSYLSVPLGAMEAVEAKVGIFAHMESLLRQNVEIVILLCALVFLLDLLLLRRLAMRIAQLRLMRRLSQLRARKDASFQRHTGGPS